MFVLTFIDSSRFFAPKPGSLKSTGPAEAQTTDNETALSETPVEEDKKIKLPAPAVKTDITTQLKQALENTIKKLLPLLSTFTEVDWENVLVSLRQDKNGEIEQNIKTIIETAAALSPLAFSTGTKVAGLGALARIVVTLFENNPNVNPKATSLAKRILHELIEAAKGGGSGISGAKGASR